MGVTTRSTQHTLALHCILADRLKYRLQLSAAVSLGFGFGLGLRLRCMPSMNHGLRLHYRTSLVLSSRVRICMYVCLCGTSAIHTYLCTFDSGQEAYATTTGYDVMVEGIAPLSSLRFSLWNLSTRRDEAELGLGLPLPDRSHRSICDL